MAINRSRVIDRLFAIALLSAISVILLVEFILGLTPPVARDAIIHHLAIPKLWLMNGGFYEITWADFSYFPMNIDLLYLIPLYFNRDFLANFIHAGFGIGTASMIYTYLKSRMGRIAGLLGILVFLSTPIVLRLSTQAYVDLGLTFFITAGILALVRYRDGNFQESRWLVISSVAMGLALGSKYNGLIAWYFLPLAVAFMYSRDTKKQWGAIGQGAVFFLVSLLVFSPWLIKNALLTGNPLYPIFSASPHAIGTGEPRVGFFQMREMLYGENLFEALLIPVRIFFQGQDNSSRYFDGVLNPVLIILPPFAFLNRSFRRDTLFFCSFALFFILTVFFLEQKAFSMEQIVRYILPVIPLLSILTVMGLVNVVNWSRGLPLRFKDIVTAALLVVFALMMSKNALYLHQYVQKIDPLRYVSGRESRDAFITRHHRSYPAMKHINTHTPEDARIRLIFLAGRGYYLDRIYTEGALYGIGDVIGLAKHSHDDRSFREFLKSLDCTHLLVRTDLYTKYLQENYPLETTNRLAEQMRKNTEMIYGDSGYAVFRLIPPG